MAQNRISTYVVLSSLGRGGMGEVVLAEDPVLKRRVAIKRLHSDALGDGDARARLLTEARAALAYVSAAYYSDWVTAEREFERAIDLKRDSGYNHGYGMMLSALGRHEEARARFSDARLRDPLGVVLQRNQAMALARARDYAGAIRLSHGKFPDVEGWALLWDGHPREALKAFEGAQPDVQDQAGIAAALAKMGRTAEARTKASSLERSNSPLDVRDLAKVYAALGDRDRTLATLERSYALHGDWMANINVEPSFDDVRADPRFVDLLRRLGLPR